MRAFNLTIVSALLSWSLLTSVAAEVQVFNETDSTVVIEHKNVTAVSCDDRWLAVVENGVKVVVRFGEMSYNESNADCSVVSGFYNSAFTVVSGYCVVVGARISPSPTILSSSARREKTDMLSCPSATMAFSR